MVVMGFPSGSAVKNQPEMRETWIRSLGQEDPLEDEMVANSSILAWEISWTEESSGLQSIGLRRVRHDWAHTRTELPQIMIPLMDLGKLS